MNNILKYSIILWMAWMTICSVKAQEVQRPPIWGIAKTTFLVGDMEKTREYYGRFLGFDEAFSYPSAIGMVVSFKVSDRQFLEFVTDTKASEKDRLVAVSLETQSAEQMRLFLKAQGVKVPSSTSIDGAGNEVFTVTDNDGNPIEFITLKTDGLHRQSKGRFLSPDRISKRIHHVGLYTATIDDQDAFWVKTLKCRELFRFPEDRSQPTIMQYLYFDDSTESVEHFSPCERDISHPCLLLEDMQDAIYTLKERQGKQDVARPNVGRGNRWILNVRDPDMNRIEFTEAFRVR
jgi:catechol 2,3-dioxygenase-like lactoylglutathione lyase family enzyme